MKKQSHIPCAACNRVPTDRAHIKSKGSGGAFTSENVIQLCRTHHQNQHQYGWAKFIDLNPGVGIVLKKMGFEIRDVFGVRKLVKL